MTTRELLRQAAFSCELMGDETCATFLRAFLARWDEEEVRALAPRDSNDPRWRQNAWDAVCEVLDRLDAPTSPPWLSAEESARITAPTIPPETGEPPINQCDGCRRGLPVVLGIHCGPDPQANQMCTKDRYEKFIAASVEADRPSASPSSHEVQRCAEWCGCYTNNLPRGRANVWYTRPGWLELDPIYCTEACAALGHPAHPVDRDAK